MATILLDLEKYAITDTGEVVIKYDCLVYDLLLNGRPITGLQTFRLSEDEAIVAANFKEMVKSRPDVEEYNYRCDDPEQRIKIAEIDGVPGKLPASCFEYAIPEEYHNIDILDYAVTKLVHLFHGETVPAIYIDRLALEYEMICQRQMQDFVRTLVYVIDMFREKNVVYGVGRGSCCASLMLYLIGVHMVDSVEFDIPITEFLR